jgi:hypothetical protein
VLIVQVPAIEGYVQTVFICTLFCYNIGYIDKLLTLKSFTLSGSASLHISESDIPNDDNRPDVMPATSEDVRFHWPYL